MAEPILITGATGNVGSEIVKILSNQGFSVRAGSHHPQKQMTIAHDGCKTVPVHFDFTRRETFEPALQGVKRLLLIRPPQIANVKKYIVPAIDAAIAMGVSHVVFLSIINVEQNRYVPHYKIEQYLRESGLTYTFLRASFFMQNFNTTHRNEIRHRDEIFVPAGLAKTSFIDVRDIAEIAAMALTESEHRNRIYELTGGTALDYDQVAEIFSQALARKITYRNPSASRFLWHTVRRGTPLLYAAIMTWLHTSTRSGMGAKVTDTVAKLLDRPPLTLQQYVQDYRAYWET